VRQWRTARRVQRSLAVTAWEENAVIDLAKEPVSSVMRSEFASLREDDRLDLADQVMRLGRVRHLPVLAPDGRVVGVVSNRDLLEASLTSVLNFEATARRSFLRSIDVAEVMVRDVETVTPETSLAAAARRLIERKIGCLPVVDGAGIMIGLVTETDLLAAAYREPHP
jgi:CBS-domain-containing membrane protein